ncbi:MAG: helicase, partial [Rhodococcus sp. (in: high G+C Gram-positive bacteria)]
LGHRAAEAYWQARTGEPVQHPVTVETVDAIVDARASEDRAVAEDFLDTTQAVLDSQESAEPATADQRNEQVEAIQDGIDQAATVEVDQWWARGRAAYDPADPLTLPQPDTDPQVAAAIGKVRSRKGRDEIRSQWFAGVEQARREATADERRALIAEVAVDPRLIAQVEGRRPDYLPAVTRSEVKSLIAEAAREAPPLRQAAAKVLLEHRLPDELYERAYAEWERVHGPELTWDQGTAAQWTAWMTMHARRDPLLGSWVGLPMYPRTPIIEIGIETAFEVMAEERPDLIAATADIPTERLAAEMRGNIIPNLPAPDPSELSAQFRDGAAYCALTLKDRPNSRVTYFPIRGWDYTLGGDSSSVTCGRNARAAIGALLEARNIALPEWIERAYRPYAQARATVLTRAIAYARNNEFYHAAASADLLWRYSQSGSAVADHALIKDVRRGIIDQLRSDFPAETALLDRYGIDLAWTLQHDVDPKVLRDLRAAGDDLYSLTPADLTFAGAGDVVIGDPDGRHITLSFSWARNSTERITYVDDQPRPELTLRDAIAEARAVLATEHAGGQFDADPATAAQTQAGVDAAEAEAEPQVSEEAEPPSPRVVAPAIDDAGAVIFEEVDPAPTEPSAPTGTAPATETPATSWVLTDRLVVGHIGPTTTGATPDVETTTEPVAATSTDEAAQPAPAVDTAELVVPDTEYGEPLSSPLWRDRSRSLVKVRKESGAYV